LPFVFTKAICTLEIEYIFHMQLYYYILSSPDSPPLDICKINRLFNSDFFPKILFIDVFHLLTVKHHTRESYVAYIIRIMKKSIDIKYFFIILMISC